MAKNAQKLYYPIREAIESILPIVDEFVVAVGDCDPDDGTLAEIEAINSPKIRIIHTVWDLNKYPNGTENAHQTDIAMKVCTGDWLFYLQADEVVHEDDLPIILNRCRELLHEEEVEGLLFNYIHFFGDYNHYAHTHNWYSREIRIVRNKKDIHSYQSAQSFRRIPDFDGKDYRQKTGTFKLNVASVDARIFHYGWVRPPELMQKKSRSLDAIHKGEEKAAEIYAERKNYFDYGPLGRLPRFTGTHPGVMQTFIQKFNWEKKLNHNTRPNPDRPLMKHEKPKYRLLYHLTKKIPWLKRQIGYSNWKLLDK